MGANWGQIPILAQEIEAMIPRDMRKRASDLAPDDVAFQAAPHSSVAVTKRHYQIMPVKLVPVR
jgi:hypothetical protein